MTTYWEHGKKEYAPKTLTELYTGLVHTLLLRYLTDHREDRDWRIRNFKDDLPDDVKQNLEAITSLAANGIKRRQYVFDEVDDNVPLDTLGLMQRGTGSCWNWNIIITLLLTLDSTGILSCRSLLRTT